MQDGNEAGLNGVALSLTDCANTGYVSSTSDSSGAYALNVPAAQNGKAVCVFARLPKGYLATGANAAGTATPDGTATTVGDSVTLVKQVRNITAGTLAWSTDNSAKSGDLLEYQITFTNVSAVPMRVTGCARVAAAHGA